MRRIDKLVGNLLLKSLLIPFLLLSPFYVSATSIIRLDMTEIVAGSNLVFEGKVIASSSQPALNGRAIMTQLTFEIKEVLKGFWPENKISLSFLGGRHGSRELRVDNMTIPVLGEQGIYFVRDPGKISMHPFKGWGQGHFIIDNKVPGEAAVRAVDGRYMVALPSSEAQESQSEQLVGGRVAKGLKLRQQPAAPITPRQFKDWIKSR